MKKKEESKVPKITIRSDGTVRGTEIRASNGSLLEGVQKVEIIVAANKSFVKARVTFISAQLVLKGLEMAQQKRKVRKERQL